MMISKTTDLKNIKASLIKDNIILERLPLLMFICHDSHY